MKCYSLLVGVGHCTTSCAVSCLVLLPGWWTVGCAACLAHIMYNIVIYCIIIFVSVTLRLDFHRSRKSEYAKPF